MNRLDLLEPGRIIDRWLVLDVLGQGGMAVVYRVRHEQLGSLHALKVVAVPSRSVMLRLVSEGRAQARVVHRNIVRVSDVIEIDGSPGLVMEYVSGPSLDDLIQAVELDLDQIDGLARGILRGVGAAHDADIVHRDLKPANVLVSVEEDGLVPKVADFGLAKDFASGDSRTKSGAFMGTPNYMSPEQVRDAKSVDARADVWAIGAILYELLTRQRAFDGVDMLEIFNKVAKAEYRPVRELRPDAPERMVRAIDAALQVDAGKRPASCVELLAIWAGGVPESALHTASYEGLDPELLAKVRALVSSPPTSVPSHSRPGETIALSVAPSSDDEAAQTLLPPDEPEPRRRPRGMRHVRVLGLALAAALVLVILVPPVLIGGGLLLVMEPANEDVAQVPQATEELQREPPPVELPMPAPAQPVKVEKPSGKSERSEPPRQQPVATPKPLPSPVPVPDPIPEPEPLPDLEPEDVDVPATPPPAPTVAAVTVEGDVQIAFRDSSGFIAVPPDVAPGTWTLVAFFDGSDSPSTVVQKDLQLQAGQQVTVTCKMALRRCKVSP